MDKTSQNIYHDYEKEAKAERHYQMALNCLFMDITNNFTLVIDNLLKAKKICPTNKRFHYLLSYCFYKVNDNNSLRNEIILLKELLFDKNIKDIVLKDILSTKYGKMAERLFEAFNRGGEIGKEAAQGGLHKEYKINYADSSKIFDIYMDFIKWIEIFEKNFY